MVPILPPSPENNRRAAEALRRGELVALPTETVYGLAGDALNPAALSRIFEVKQRPFFDPLIVHIADRAWVGKLCVRVSDQAQALMDHFWPGPLTLALPKTDRVPDLATSGLSTVALRMPSHPVALALLRETGIPLAAPSANPFGGLSPTAAEHVAAAFTEGIDCILDGGPCAVGVESTVLGWENDEPILLRAGGIPVEDIETVLKKKIASTATVGGAHEERPLPSPTAPGQLPSHYAPRTPLILWDPESPVMLSRAGLLWFGDQKPPEGFGVVENLSPGSDLREAAAHLFAALHRLDALGLDRIDARLVPEIGLGRAINDRLRRAAHLDTSA